MGSARRIAAAFAAMSWLACPWTFGEDVAVATAEEAAVAAASTPEGKQFKQDVADAFGREQGKTLQACASTMWQPELSDFRLFMQFDAKGKVRRALVSPTTKMAVCLRDKIKGWKANVPAPQARTWVSLAVRLQKE